MAIKNKKAKKARQRKIARKQQILDLNKSSRCRNIDCEVTSFSEHMKILTLVKKIFSEFKWKDLSVKLSDNEITVNVSYLLSQDTYVFRLDEKYPVISQLKIDAYASSFRVGVLKDYKDTVIVHNFIRSELKTKRRGIESENKVYIALQKILPEEFTIRFDKDLDALSFDFWVQYLDTESGLFLQVKSSERYIPGSVEKFEEKKSRAGLEDNRYWSLLQDDNPLHYVVVEGGRIYALGHNYERQPFKEYILSLLKGFNIKKIA